MPIAVHSLAECVSVQAARRRPSHFPSVFAVCVAWWAFSGVLVLQATAGNEELRTVRVGYQKYGSFSVIKAQGAFDRLLGAKGVHVEWFLFPAGPQLLEALNAGSIDLGHTGEAPPIFARRPGFLSSTLEMNRLTRPERRFCFRKIPIFGRSQI